VADGWCWFVLREKYYWLVAGGWFVLKEKYCWVVVDKPNEQGVDLATILIEISVQKKIQSSKMSPEIMSKLIRDRQLFRHPNFLFG
jgi:hypothetical protein